MSVEVTWFGHAWFMAESQGKRVLFDPLSKKDSGRIASGIVPDVSAKPDLILISHSHSDHWNPDTIESYSSPSTIIVAPHKPAQSIPGSKEIAAGETLDADGVQVKAVPAHNLHKFFHRKGKGVGYLVKLGGKVIYHAGDTDAIPEMSSLGHVDVALLPIGGKFTMDVDEAAQAARMVSPSVAVPMHNLDTPGIELSKRLADTPSIRVIVPEIGKPFSI
ncbi:MAG TPA: MBL fold metallo-hydrolase [Methanomassiliicoccales archaeon]|nr:MBL fold metallo-hydrolase [Methanomassiliicoccales archaeon]